METTATPPLKRPVQVTIAVWLMVANAGIFLTKAILYLDWRDPYTYATVSLGIVVVLIWIYPILRRQGWARWILLSGTVLCCMQAGGRLRKSGVNWEAGREFLLVSSIIVALLSWTKVFLLFSKPANDWFRKGKEELEPPPPPIDSPKE